MSTQSPHGGRIRRFLRENTFFKGLPDDALDTLISKGHTEEYAKGSVIYRRDEPGESLMVVLSGRIKITNTTTDGKDVILNFLGEGGINGEIAALDGKGRTADAVALEDCQVFAVYMRDLAPLLVAYPAAGMEVIKILCAKLRAASAMIEDSVLEMRERTAKGLLRLISEHGRAGADGIRLDLAMSQRELGAYLGISRANVSRQLTTLRDANVIRIDGPSITIIDESGLSAIAEDAD